ncbi:DUF4974 domain-containing protein [Chitinophaga sp. SYP-B3965]|uniref:FecR family protein n=1 Tax=Chitinophaga sp. SYP-B3965 TaxID=2663120 RepID=UPI0012996EC3|nr:FecR domain-containing protein [Chitinophaga sp. SYP-B3965]MRG44823.1 DUF4974 domain-containing protein [Chitinophaga sp. SYP-B3965]
MKHNVEEIRSLMIEKLDNQIGPEDELLLQRLITEDKRVQELWDEMQALFVSGDGLQVMERLNTGQEWESLQQQLKRSKRRRYIGFASAAAAAVVGLLVYFNLQKAAPAVISVAPKSVLLKMDNGETIDLSAAGHEAIVAGDAKLHNNGKVLSYEGGQSTQWSTITVPAGMDYQVRLSDSSTLWLNSATTARFPVHFTGDTREIEVNGEAYLQVAKDAARPFIVHLPGADVHVLGTAFNINSYDPGVVKVALVEGGVNMRTPTETVGLKPGFQGMVSTGETIQVQAFEERRVLSWMKGQYVFYNTPVLEISQILQRCYDMEVVFDNETVGKKCFTGIIKKQQPLQEFLDNLTATAEVNYYFKGRVLHFK